MDRRSLLEERERRLAAAPARHFVFELGANNGNWVRDFCEKFPHFVPHIFEPQPRCVLAGCGQGLALCLLLGASRPCRW